MGENDRRTINYCFACGPANPIGLKLKFEQTDDLCRTVFTPKTEHQGWYDVMHGGLITTLLDEVMANWLWGRDIPAMTAEMTTRFMKPVPIGAPVTVTAKRVGGKGKLVLLESELVLADGTPAARASSKFIITERGLAGD